MCFLYFPCLLLMIFNLTHWHNNVLTLDDCVICSLFSSFKFYLFALATGLFTESLCYSYCIRSFKIFWSFETENVFTASFWFFSSKTFLVSKMSWRCLQDIFSRRLEDVFSVTISCLLRHTIFHLPRRRENVLTSSRTCLENVLMTS